MANKERFPQLVVDRKKLAENIAYAVRACGEQGISVTGVIKGFSALAECLPVYLESGVKSIASSRLAQLRRVKELMESGLPQKDLLLLRVPMLSEIEEVIELCDASLNSELVVLRALNEEALKQGKVHKVILMADLGDLREGFWDKDEMAEVAETVERELKGLRLLGIGTNLGCYGALVPTAEKVGELEPIAAAIEKRIGRPLDVISGGASTSFMRVTDGDMPKRINNLRMGENIIVAYDNAAYHGHDTAPMHRDVWTLRAEVLEVKDKPTHPVGTINVDAFGQTPTYPDRGIRKRALLGVGKVDLGSPFDVFPRLQGVEVLGGSSDHLILDIEDAERDLKPGDIVEFDIDYGSLVFLSASEDVKIVCKN